MKLSVSYRCLLYFCLAVFGSALTAAPASAQPVAAHDSAFYLSINLATMRDGTASAPLYRWVEGEVLEDLRDELGTDLIDSLEGVSIFGTGAEQVPAVVLHGTIPQSARDRIVDGVFESKGEIELKTLHGRNYYSFSGLELDWDGVENHDGGDGDGSNHDALLIAFGDQGQSMITPDPLIMDLFLRHGELAQAEMAPDLMVLQANRALIQGGLSNRQNLPGVGPNGPWESEMFRKVERFGIILADENDAVSFTLEAQSATPEVAEAMANLVEGLISLKALSGENDPELEWLDSLDISTQDRITRFQARFPAEQLVTLLD